MPEGLMQMASCSWIENVPVTVWMTQLWSVKNAPNWEEKVTVLMRNSSWYQHTPSFWNQCTRSFRSLFYWQTQQHISMMYLVGQFVSPACITWNIQGCVCSSILFSRICLGFYFSYKKCRLKAGTFWRSPPYLMCHFSMTGSMTVISTLTFSTIQLNISTIHSSSSSLIKGMPWFLCLLFFPF